MNDEFAAHILTSKFLLTLQLNFLIYFCLLIDKCSFCPAGDVFQTLGFYCRPVYISNLFLLSFLTVSL